MEKPKDSDLRLALADALEIVLDAVIMLDANHCILFFNQGAEHIFGYRSEEILGQSLDWLLPSRFVTAHHDHTRAFSATPEVAKRMGDSLHVRGRRKDGSEFPAEVSLSKLVWHGQTTFTVIVRDVTDRLQADEILRRWLYIFDYIEWGVAMGSADGETLEMVNPAFARMHGYCVGELAGKPIRYVFAPESWSELPNQIRVAHEKGHHTYESTHIRKDGTVFPVLVDVTAVKDDAGRVLHRIVNVQDITERKQIEQALRESEERYRSIVTTIQEGIVFQDADGRISACNTSAERILGLSREQMMGRTPLDPRWRVIHEDGSPFPGDLRPAMVTLRTGRPQSNVIVGVHKPDGTLAWISINSQPLFRPGETAPYAVVSSLTDITERMQTYQLLEQRVEERTRELSTLLEISHNVASTLELKPLLRLIFEQLKCVVNYTSAAIFSLEDQELVILEYRVPTLERPVQPLRLPLEEAGLGQTVICSREPVIVDDVQGDIPLARAFKRLGGSGVETIFGYAHSWMAIPLIAKDKVIGMLGLAYEEPGYYTSQHARLVLTIANQAAVAMENARLYEQARHLSALEERQRLARELHDSVSQALYSIALGARTARAWLDRDPAKAAEPLDYVRSLAEAGLAEMRALIFELRPESLESEGLVAALTKQADAVHARHGIEVHLCLCDEPTMSMEVREILYRIAQEALHNIIKHARASRASLALVCTEAGISLEVTDNGIGFDTAKPFPGHLGLRSMRERAERAGGKFDVSSSPGGTCIQVQIKNQL